MHKLFVALATQLRRSLSCSIGRFGMNVKFCTQDKAPPPKKEVSLFSPHNALVEIFLEIRQPSLSFDTQHKMTGYLLVKCWEHQQSRLHTWGHSWAVFFILLSCLVTFVPMTDIFFQHKTDCIAILVSCCNFWVWNVPQIQTLFQDKWQSSKENILDTFLETMSTNGTIIWEWSKGRNSFSLIQNFGIYELLLLANEQNIPSGPSQVLPDLFPNCLHFLLLSWKFGKPQAQKASFSPLQHLWNL